MGVVVVLSVLAVLAVPFAVVVALRDRRRSGPAVPVAAMLVCAGLWTTAGLNVLLTAGGAAMTTGFLAFFPLGSLLAAAVIWHALVLARGAGWRWDRRLLLLLVEPVVVTAVVLSDPSVVLDLGATGLVGTMLVIVFTPWGWWHIAYCLALVVAGGGLMVQATVRAIPAHRSRYLLALLALGLPTLGAVVSIGLASSLGAVDLTGAASVVTALVWLWTARMDQATATLPISLRQVVAAVGDAVVVIEGTGRVVLANPAAQRMLGPQGCALVDRVEGSRWTEVMGADREHPGLTTLACGVVLDIRYTDLDGIGAGGASRVAVLRDVTDVERMRMDLAEQAVRDGLTGLHNRRHLEVALPAAVARAQESGQQLSAVMLDVDHFKALNDTYGHSAGDEVLVAVARVLTEHLRADEVLVRFGGEEFLALVPGAGPAEVARRMDRVRQACAQIVGGRESGVAGVTVSIGVARLEETMTPDQLLRAADDALYAAKAAGRDRVVVG